MALTVGAREKAILTQTLAPLLLGLIGNKKNQIIIELKNELQISGVIEAVDCFMNVTMSDAFLSSPNGPLSQFGFVFLQRRSLRAVQIPENLHVGKLLKDQVEVVTGVRAREERRKAKLKRANYLRRKEKKRMEEEEEEKLE